MNFGSILYASFFLSKAWTDQYLPLHVGYSRHYIPCIIFVNKR